MKAQTQKSIESNGLTEQEVHVWTVWLNIQSVAEKEQMELLSSDERSRAVRFVRQIDRDRFVKAHSTVRTVLARYTGIAAAEVEFELSPHGRPALKSVPHLDFNLSHSGDLALIALRRGGRVGVDVEQTRPDIIESEVAERFFSRSELAQLGELRETEQVNAFYRCWTRKEAYLKALGCGISDESLRRVEVSLRGEDEPAIRQPVPGDSAIWSIASWEPESGYIAAAVADGAALEFRMRKWPCDFTAA
jgi:4'-phosphopantetheinyl transferase